MNTILFYTILVSVLAVIIVEEVRDARYFPLLITAALGLLGAALALGGLQFIPSKLIPGVMVILTLAAIITALVFFRDLRQITRIQRDVALLSNEADEYYEETSSMRSEAKATRNKAVEIETSVLELIGSTEESIEAMHHG